MAERWKEGGARKLWREARFPVEALQNLESILPISTRSCAAEPGVSSEPLIDKERVDGRLDCPYVNAMRSGSCNIGTGKTEAGLQYV